MKIPETSRHFVDDRGTPVFWLGDTAWNGVLCAEDEQWEQYLATRREQGFNVIQFVTTQWRGRFEPRIGMPLDIDGEHATVNENVFQTMDRRIAMIAEHGMTPAPVMFWSITAQDVGQCLSESTLIEIGREMVRRWSAHDPIWLLAGDGYYPATVDRWSRVGRGIFGPSYDQTVTMHPCGASWVGELFANEPWYKFVGIQSGHGAANQLPTLLKRSWSSKWPQIAKPFINLEPNYEDHPMGGAEHLGRYNAYHVRRAAYFSLLTAPPAGITFGKSEIWAWPQQPGLIDGHQNLGPVGAWHEGLETEGIAHMRQLKRIFETLAWTNLRPEPNLLGHQPGDEELARYIPIAATPDHATIVAYSPCGDPIQLAQPEASAAHDSSRQADNARWIDPRTGQSPPAAQASPHDAEDDISCNTPRFVPPSATDWLLVID